MHQQLKQKRKFMIKIALTPFKFSIAYYNRLGKMYSTDKKISR